MKKIFAERARFVIYVESADMDSMEALARSRGRTLVEWARETLLESLNGKAVRRSEPVRVARRRPLPGERGPAPDIGYSGGGESAHAHAQRLAAEAAVAENPESSSVAASEMDVVVARRSGHAVGCECAFICAKLRKMMAKPCGS